MGTSPCSPDEWEKILKAVLLGHEPVEGIEAGAECQVGKEITITIRRRVAGISVSLIVQTLLITGLANQQPKQRLGTIKLEHKPDKNIQLFEWCGEAIQERERLREVALVEGARAQDLESRVKQLRDQLDELTRAKKAGETEMLEKVCILLNEKKVKIREQQRLLSTASVNPSKLTSLPADLPTSPKRVPKASRASKRKAPARDASDDSDDGFEKMDVDKTNNSRAPPSPGEKDDDTESEEDAITPIGDETETGSEPDEEEEEQPLPSASSYQRKKPATAADTGQGKGKGKEISSPPRLAPKGKDTLAVHPKRIAKNPSPSPARSAAARHRLAPVSASNDSETESDDEL